jgi:hypothetical protein
MADPSRFPQLALPFTLVGAAAGWLSAGLVNNPFLDSTPTSPWRPPAPRRWGR